MNRWYRLHIRNELIAWFLILSVLPLALLTGVNYYYQKSSYLSQSQNQLKRLLDEKILDINQEIESISRQLEIFSRMPTVKKTLTYYNQRFEATQEKRSKQDDYKTSFAQMMAENQFYDIFLINAKGDVVYSVKEEQDLGTNLRDGPYSKTNLAKTYYSSLAFLDIKFSDFEYYPPSDEEAAFSVIPIYGENRMLGALAVQIDRSRLLNILANYRGLGQTGEYVAARFSQNKKLLPVINTRLKPDALDNQFEFLNHPQLPIYLAATGNNGYGVTTDYRGKQVVAAWSYLPTLNWGLVAKRDISEVLIPINHLRFYSILMMFFVGLGLLFFIYSSIRRIIKPIEELTKSVNDFSQGGQISRIDVNVENEVGKLSQTFNDMATSITESQKRIRDYATGLEHKVQERTSALEKAGERLKKKNKKLEKFMSIIDKNIISYSFDIHSKILTINQALSDISGYSKEELVGRKYNLLHHPDMPSESDADLWQTISQGKIWKGELKCQRKDGTDYWVASTISPVFDDKGEIIELTSIQQDISDRKKVEKLSITDQLTQLYNRRKIDEIFQTEIHRAYRYHEVFSVMIFDVDWFKSVNDNFGHNVGDQVLVKIAQSTQTLIRQTDTLGRWGGEEFIVICPQTTGEKAKLLAEKIRNTLSLLKHDQLGQVTASFGVADFTTNDTETTVLKRADDALYKSKQNGRNQVTLA